MNSMQIPRPQKPEMVPVNPAGNFVNPAGYPHNSTAGHHLKPAIRMPSPGGATAGNYSLVPITLSAGPLEFAVVSPGGHAATHVPQHFVRDVVSGGNAHLAGLCVGDRLVKVQGEVVTGMTHEQVLGLLTSLSSRYQAITMFVERGTAQDWARTNLSINAMETEQAHRQQQEQEAANMMLSGGFNRSPPPASTPFTHPRARVAYGRQAGPQTQVRNQPVHFGGLDNYLEQGRRGGGGR